MQYDSLTNYIKSFKHFLTDKQYEVSIDKMITLHEAKNELNRYIKDWYFYLSKKEYIHQLRLKFSKIFIAYEEDKENVSNILSLIEDWINFINIDEINNYDEYQSLKDEITKLKDDESKEERDIKKLIDDFIFSDKYESLQNECDLIDL